MNNPDQDPTGEAAPRRSEASLWTEIASLQRRLELQRLLSEVSGHFINLPADEIDGHINRALERVGTFLGFNQVAISTFSGQGTRADVTHIWTALGLLPTPPGLTDLDFPWCAERLTQGHPVYLTSLDDLPTAGQRDRQTYERLAIRSIYNWPLRVAGATVGCLGLAFVGGARPFPGEFEEELKLLAQVLASTLERTRADRALRESEARLSLAADAAELGLWSLNLATGQFWLTDKTRELFEFTPGEEVTFERFVDFVHPGDQELVRETVRRMVQAMSDGLVEYRAVRPDGSVRRMLSRGRMHCSASGKSECLMGVTMDITEQRRAELEIQQQRNQLTHLSRVNMLGELAGSLAHELNQPLTAILSNAQAAQRFLAHDPVDLSEVRDILTDIVAEDKRAGEVIRRLRLLLKTGEVQHQPLDVNEVVQEVLKLVRSDLVNHNFTAQTELAPHLPVLHGDRVQIEQVLLNLVMNACDAMAGAARDQDQRQLAIGTRQAEDGSVHISVADCGVGLAPEKLEQVFEPFYSTKAHGLGLGLTVCRTIVAAHGGRMWATNNPGPGATFYFTLPVSGKGRVANGKSFATSAR